MKRLLSLLITLMLVFSLSGCGNNNQNERIIIDPNECPYTCEIDGPFGAVDPNKPCSWIPPIVDMGRDIYFEALRYLFAPFFMIAIYLACGHWQRA